MKGFMIYETPLWGDEENVVYLQEVKDASYTLKQVDSDDITCYLEGIATKEPITKATCNKDDTYDFEMGALIALMKKCGVKKVAEACNEAFPHETAGSIYRENKRYVKRIKELEEKVDNLYTYNKSLIDDIDKKNHEIISLKALKLTNESLKKDNESFRKTINTLKEKFDKKVSDLRDQIHENSILIQTNGELEDKVKELKKEKEQIIVAKNILYNKLEKENEELKSDKDKSWKNYQRNIQKKQDRINELERAYKASNDDKAKLVEYYQREIKKLEVENEKLQHGYNNADILFCGGRDCGKQHKALVALFKKLDQKKVDDAYKEAYNTTLPVWQKEVLKQMYEIPTKREEMWEKIFALHKENDVIIEVKKEDVNTFLHEIEDKIPEITWRSGAKIFKLNHTIKYIYEEELESCDTIYFRLRKENTLSYSNDSYIYPYRDLVQITYLPPMRWDLFKKGRIAVKITYNNRKEFYESCEKELGKKPSFIYTGDFTVSICKKDGNFEIFTMEDQKKTGRKIVNWEDVR